MANRAPFAPGEYYHCYNRGIDKRKIFETTRDYQRFIQGLYLCNNTEPMRLDDLQDYTHGEILMYPRGQQLVAIGAYCLMPNHFHFLLKEIAEGGITKFMRRLGIAYTMYYNIKNERVGNLLTKPFRSKRIADDRYFRRVAQYIHLNPAELFEPAWKIGRVKNLPVLQQRLLNYPYSSFSDYYGNKRVENVLLHKESKKLLGENLPPIKDILLEAKEYYAGLKWGSAR